jgi:hypothetical protein
VSDEERDVVDGVNEARALKGAAPNREELGQSFRDDQRPACSVRTFVPGVR